MSNIQKITFLPPHKQEKSISLNLQHIITAKKPSKMTPPAPLFVSSLIKPYKFQPVETQSDSEIIKRILLDEQNRLLAVKSKEENNITKAPKKPVEKIVKKVQKKQPKKVVKKKKKQKVKKSKKQKVKKKIVKRRVKHSNDPLANMLQNVSTTIKTEQSSRKKNNIRMIKQFYGTEFNSFTPVQKKFIEKNLGSIYRITQRTLTRNGYPPTAVRTQQQGTNIVTFYLHPNGDISRLRLKRRIGYAALDKNTLRTIRIAYKDYPRPKTKTKITFYVEYNLY